MFFIGSFNVYFILVHCVKQPWERYSVDGTKEERFYTTKTLNADA